MSEKPIYWVVAKKNELCNKTELSQNLTTKFRLNNKGCIDYLSNYEVGQKRAYITIHWFRFVLNAAARLITWTQKYTSVVCHG